MRNSLSGKLIYPLLGGLFVVLSAFILVEWNTSRPAYIIKALNLQNGLSQPAKSIMFRAKVFGFLVLGQAQMNYAEPELFQGKEVYHLTAEARAAGLISRFLNARVEIDSIVDKKRMHSLRFTQIMEMLDKPKDERVIIYDQENNVMESRGVKRSILPDTRDPLSAMLYIQNQNFQLGKEFDINVNTSQKNYRLYLKVIKKEEYVINGSKVGAWVLEGDVKRRDKSPRHSIGITVWILDSPYKVPFLLKVTTNIGPITAWLVEVR